MTCLQYLGKNLKNKPFGFLILYRIFFTILFLITSGCDTVGDFFTEEEEILPGKREPVLADRKQLESKFDFVKIRDISINISKICCISFLPSFKKVIIHSIESSSIGKQTKFSFQNSYIF